MKQELYFIGVTKQKGGQYYAFYSNQPKVPIKGSYGTKKEALKFAANLMEMSLKEYLNFRKKNQF